MTHPNPSPKPTPKPTPTPSQRAARAPDPQRVVVRRDLFWQNVMREILSALAAAAGSGGRLTPTPKGAAYSPGPIDDMFDGRLALITNFGQRIPIADIIPVFACSVPSSTEKRCISSEVQCTVYQVRTPAGEIYTLPISEIRAFHSLSEELVRTLEERAEAISGDGSAGQPFGFGAFTSLESELEESETADDA